MRAPRLLVVQPDDNLPIGPLEEWLADAGASLDVRRVEHERIPTDLSDYQGLVCLGGRMSHAETKNYPWLTDIRSVLSTAISGKLPILGIGLGAQLLVLAMGGAVARGEHGAKFGPGLVSKKDVAWTDPLFADLPLLQDVVWLHDEVIETLPNGADLLGSSTTYPHQVFRINHIHYGLQFHIETTPHIVAGFGQTASTKALNQTELNQLHVDMAETWGPFAARFVRLCAGQIAPATSSRTLPLV